MADALSQLKERLTRVTDVERVSRVLSWDQQTMMPPAGTEHRGDHLATLRRIQHETLIDPETGRLLDELKSLGDSLEPDSDDAALLRLARRDYEKAVKVPTDLRAEMTRAAAEARTIWVKARAESDFEQFRPALERNYELRQRYVECFGDRNLNMVDVISIPQRLEYAVGEPKYHDVLNRLLSEIVVDAKDLALGQHAENSAIEGLGGTQIAAEGLLDDDAPPMSVRFIDQSGVA